MGEFKILTDRLVGTSPSERHPFFNCNMKATYHRIVTQESSEEWDNLRITVHNAKWIELVHQKTNILIKLDPQTIRLLNQILRELD